MLIQWSYSPVGSEADFSSSSSSGSLKAKGNPAFTLAPKKAPSRRCVHLLPRRFCLVARLCIFKQLNNHCYCLLSRGTHIRSLPVFKPAGSPMANRDAELYAPYKTPKAASSTNSSSCASSPTSRCETFHSWSCVWPYVQTFYIFWHGFITNPFFPD